MTLFKDVVWMLLIVFLLPVWMVLGLGAVVVVLTRQLYWWARGNTSIVSRAGGRGSSWSLYPETGARPPHADEPVGPVPAGHLAGAAARTDLTPAVAGVSVR